MQSNYPLIQSWIGLSEGGFVNHPDDPGGATDRGITQATFDAWNRMQGQPLRPVRGISRAEAEAIIALQYLDKVGADRLPSGLDYCVADYAVNSGVAQAARDLQRVLGVRVDGIVGAKTLAAAASAAPEAVIAALCARRMHLLRGLTTWGTFGSGWSVRVMGQVAGAQAGDCGVIDRATRLAVGATAIPAPVQVAPGKAEPVDRSWLAALAGQLFAARGAA